MQRFLNMLQRYYFILKYGRAVYNKIQHMTINKLIASFIF